MTEGADAAAPAEVVLGRHGAKLVQAEIGLTGQDTEVCIVGSVPEGAFHAADRTIALDGSANVAIKLEGDTPTVTRTFVLFAWQGASRAVQRLT